MVPTLSDYTINWLIVMQSMPTKHSLSQKMHRHKYENHESSEQNIQLCSEAGIALVYDPAKHCSFILLYWSGEAIYTVPENGLLYYL
ncbi:hypothetical protein XELAEV_18047434mg [Xenopus laevis]|uniref:Uncharacterized protein n=1 Tax=Xenopus laevis TaxID=8355 RepID=A0A974H1W7_XENLA|nr:hypothetical protein XELAEV_18047434mg [Xenopus laevis]